MNEEFRKSGLKRKRRIGTNLASHSFSTEIHSRSDISEANYQACATQLAPSLQTQRSKYVVRKKAIEPAIGSKYVRETFGYEECPQLAALARLSDHEQQYSSKNEPTITFAKEYETPKDEQDR